MIVKEISAFLYIPKQLLFIEAMGYSFISANRDEQKATQRVLTLAEQHLDSNAKQLLIFRFPDFKGLP